MGDAVIQKKKMRSIWWRGGAVLGKHGEMGVGTGQWLTRAWAEVNLC